MQRYGSHGIQYTLFTWLAIKLYFVRLRFPTAVGSLKKISQHIISLNFNSTDIYHRNIWRRSKQNVIYVLPLTSQFTIYKSKPLQHPLFSFVTTKTTAYGHGEIETGRIGAGTGWPVYRGRRQSSCSAVGAGAFSGIGWGAGYGSRGVLVPVRGRDQWQRWFESSSCWRISSNDFNRNHADDNPTLALTTHHAKPRIEIMPEVRDGMFEFGSSGCIDSAGPQFCRAYLSFLFFAWIWPALDCVYTLNWTPFVLDSPRASLESMNSN